MHAGELFYKKAPNDKNGTAVVWKFECADGMRHTDLRPIVNQQQRAICTATKAEMRDLHTGGPEGGGGTGTWSVNKDN